MDNDILNKLSKLEKNCYVVQFFKFRKTTSWIDIKNYLYSKSLNNLVSNPTSNKNFFLNKNGIFLLLISIINYLKYTLYRKEKILYVGAGSGLFYYKNNILDSYFPQELEGKDVLYMLSADYPEKLVEYLSFIKKEKIIIYSFLVAPLKIILTRFFKYFIDIKKYKDISSFLNASNVNANENELVYIHTKFIVTYYLYRLFFLFFKIKQAYVVSAYSNTELISVLKEKGIEIIELQHGVIGTVHRGYNYAIKDELLPTPNKIYVYDTFWKDELLKAGYYTASQIIVTGRLKYELVEKDISIYENRYIVFTGQGGFYREIEKLFKNAQDFLKKNNLKLIYLSHPNETNKDLNNLADRVNKYCIIFLKEKSFTTEQYIYNSLAHISVYSSCHFDAVYYKNKTYVFDVMQDNPMQYYISNFRDNFTSMKNINEITGIIK